MKILSGMYKGRILKTITAEGYRPAMAKVRAAIFSMLSSRGYDCDGLRILDLFAGSGSLAFEALSRGALHASFVESNIKAVKVIERNAQLLTIPSDTYTIFPTTVERMLRTCTNVYDIIFIDPPYHRGLLLRSLKLLNKVRCFHQDSIIITETEPDLIFDPYTLHPAFYPIVDASYGQTRVHFWSPT